MTMKTVLLSIGGQSLLVAFCIHNSYGSWTELQTSLAIIGCSCLFFCALLHFMVIPSDSASDSKKSSRITSHDALQNTKMNTATMVNQTRFTSPPHIKPEEEMSPTANTNYTIPANQSLNLSMESFDGILSSMSPLPSLGLSPTKSPKTPKSPNSSSNLKRTIRSPTASMCKPVLSTSSNQELQPLLQIEAMRGNRTDMNTMNTVNNKRTGKRTDYLDWTDYFLSVAMLSAMRSKDPSTQVGACIVNEEKRIVGIGYNGFPRGCSDEELPWNRKSDKGENDTKYPYVCHAEMNAIMNKNSATCKDCTMYVVLFPCNDCAKLIIQSGIRRIIYICDKYAQTNSVIASKRLFNMAGVQYTQYVPKTKSVLINFPLPDQ